MSASEAAPGSGGGAPENALGAGPGASAPSERASSPVDAREMGPREDGGTAGDRPAATRDASAAGSPVGSAAPSAGVVINGAIVPRERAIAFIHIGHSNMAGRATGPDALKPFFYETHPQLWIYQKNAIWRAAREPTAPDSGTGSMAGPGMALLKTALALRPDAHFISLGFGRSGTQGGYCSSFRRGGLFWDTYMAPARELRGKVTFGAIFTMLGITENRFDAATNAQFAECMKAVAGDIRAELGEPSLPFLVGDFEREQRNERITEAFKALIIAQIARVPELVPGAAVIPTDGLPMQDEHHFNLAGHKMWADRGFALGRTKSLLPWLSAR